MNFNRPLPMVRSLASVVFAIVMLSLAVASADEAKPKAGAGDPKTSDAKGVEFFEQRIRPVLVARCYKCHSAKSEEIEGGLRLDDRTSSQAGGDTGPAVVPGNIEKSLLIETIEYTGDLYDMPPDGKLPAHVIADFRRWVEMGAPDPRESKVTKSAPAKSNSAASREDLWVLSPLHRPANPPVENEAWISGDLDRFVLARLEQSKLNPADKADRYTLLRRVTFDLTGLPPTPKEIESFINDHSDHAFEKVVDRLLASPGFGDRWARHWLDLSCYADLADVQGNVVIRGAWRYRDYVINALHHDKPFDQFIHEQIAGDLLPYETVQQQREQMIATGYLSIGPWALQNYVKKQLQADVVDHQIDKIGRTFLGMTISCAKCHDHKFDPIPTRDYYALAGIFHSTLTTRYDGPGVWSQIVSRPLPDLPGAVAEFKRVATKIQQQQRRLGAELEQLQNQEAVRRFATKVVSKTANALTLTSPIAANEADNEYRVSFAAGPSVWAGANQATNAADSLVLQVLRQDGTVLKYHVHRPKAWSGKSDAQQLSGESFVYAGDGSGNLTLHITASVYTGRFSGAIDDLSITELETSKIVFEENFNGGRLGETKGQQAGTKLNVYAGCSFEGWTGGGINHSHAVDLGSSSGKPNIALQIFSGPAVVSDNPRIAAINRELESLASRLQSAKPGLTRALAVQDIKTPQDNAIYIRGNFRALGKVVPRGFLSAVSDQPSPAIPRGVSGRKELAEWLTSKHNPATPRVLANRVWVHLFGAGLVRTVDYFGVHGDQPSHPELLDYLAIRFRDDYHWSLKSLIREMVLSQTYRMSSAHNRAAAKIDPDNRWLWRMSRRRLTAEAIRDSMLAISGKLNEERGGPSLGLDIPGNVGGGGVNPPTYTSKKTPDHVVNRRAIYQPLLRSRPTGALEILSVFDFPHPSEITGQRAEKTVATQALFLMNAPLVKQHARAAAERLFGQEVASANVNRDEPRVRRLYLRLLNRPASDDEVQQALDFVNQYQRSRAALPNPPSDLRTMAWTEFCQALFASNDFLFKE